jgi:hypothetical protein
MVGQAVEQRGGHFGVAKYAGPFAEGEIGRYDHRRLLIEAADQVEQQLPACLREWQIAEFVEDDEVLAAKVVGKVPLAPRACFGLQLVDQIDDIEESASGTATNARAGNCDGEMTFARAGRTRGILPNITTPMGGSFTGITLATVRAWRS